VEGGVVLEPASAAEAAPVSPAPRTRALGRVAGAGAELVGVDKAYGAGPTRRAVLQGFSARFAPGRLTAVSGRSGSGKSTILRLLAGLELPDAGEVRIDGESPVAGSRAERARLRRRALALVTQEPSLVDFLSATENVALGLALRGTEGREAEERAEIWLAELGLGERARQRVHRLSAGERQRVAIARALASAPPLLLVDEPTARLDEANAAALGELLAAAAGEHGTTIVCATHEPLLIAAADEEVAL
jgi:ABC-type lipoprotein export system ATPase subunit